MLYLPAPNPIKVFPVAVPTRISMRAVPFESSKEYSGVEIAVICLTETTTVPSKVEPGVMTKPVVAVAFGAW